MCIQITQLSFVLFRNHGIWLSRRNEETVQRPYTANYDIFNRPEQLARWLRGRKCAESFCTSSVIKLILNHSHTLRVWHNHAGTNTASATSKTEMQRVPRVRLPPLLLYYDNTVRSVSISVVRLHTPRRRFWLEEALVGTRYTARVYTR